MELELDLVNDIKEAKGNNGVAARVSVCALNSQPVDYEGSTKTIQHSRNFIVFLKKKNSLSLLLLVFD